MQAHVKSSLTRPLSVSYGSQSQLTCAVTSLVTMATKLIGRIVRVMTSAANVVQFESEYPPPARHGMAWQPSRVDAFSLGVVLWGTI